MSKRWDTYFKKVCEAVGSNSPCFSRQLGALLVRDKSIISTGYNGPPRGVPHCGEERDRLDLSLARKKSVFHKAEGLLGKEDCPRKQLGYKSGEGLDWCIAAHAERNCIVNAAREGVSTLGSTLYLNCIVPCKDCLIELINAGIEEIVCDSLERFDIGSDYLIQTSGIRIRRFNVGEDIDYVSKESNIKDYASDYSAITTEKEREEKN